MKKFDDYFEDDFEDDDENTNDYETDYPENYMPDKDEDEMFQKSLRMKNLKRISIKNFLFFFGIFS